MIIDSSALIAIMRDEPDARVYSDAIEQASVRSISAGSLLEAGVVVDAIGDAVASRRLDELIEVGQIGIEPVTADQVALGRAAYRDFGKGSGHPAQLNFGDCFAYALARASGEPLLFKGSDFIHTDVRPAT